MSITDLEQQVEEMQRMVATPVRGAEPDFAERLKESVQRRLASRLGRHNTASSEDDESFGQKLARAVKARVGTRRHEPLTQASYLRRPAT